MQNRGAADGTNPEGRLMLVKTAHQASKTWRSNGDGKQKREVQWTHTDAGMLCGATLQICGATIQICGGPRRSVVERATTTLQNEKTPVAYSENVNCRGREDMIAFQMQMEMAATER